MDAGVSYEAAPEPAAEFDEYGAGHDDDGREAELDDGVVAGGEAVEAFEGDLEEGGDHDDGEDEDANGFKTAAADRVGVLVLLGDEFCGCPDYSGGEEIESCVDKGSEDGEGGCEDHDSDFAGEEDGVGDEVDVDG